MWFVNDIDVISYTLFWLIVHKSYNIDLVTLYIFPQPRTIFIYSLSYWWMINFLVFESKYSIACRACYAYCQSHVMDTVLILTSAKLIYLLLGLEMNLVATHGVF